MALRASDADVRAIIDTDPAIATTIPIRAANTLVDWINDKCDQDNVLTAAQLGEIETWLAAHFYAHRDPQYSSKATEKASATFQGATGMGLESTVWGQTAMTLDPTGCLASRNKGGKAGVLWLGKAPSDQTDYEDRD